MFKFKAIEVDFLKKEKGKIMIWNYKENQISSVDDKGETISEVDFVKSDNNSIDITHVFVSPEYRGQGVADNTMLAVVEYLRNQNLKATASCSYANSWLNKNEEEYADVISAEMKNQAAACRIDGKH